MDIIDQVTNFFHCENCKITQNEDSCMKCKVTEGFRSLRAMDTKSTVILLIVILAVLMYMDIIPHPFKTQTKQHLQYFFF